MKHANLINMGLFQITWFACVAGGSLWGLGALCLMLGLSWKTNSLVADLTLGAGTAITGFLADTLWIYAGVLDYFGAVVAPLWSVILWMGIGLSLNHGLAFFKMRPVVGGLLAAGAAPVCYLSGQALGAVIVPDSPLLASVAVTWFVLFWLAFRLLDVRQVAAPELET